MKPKLAFDTRMANHSGIGTYVRGVFEGFRKTNLLNDFEVSCFGLRPNDVGEFAHEDFNAPIYSISEQISYGSKLSQCDLWHAPHYNVPYRKPACKLVVTIHDLIHWIYRDQLNPLKRWYAGTMLKRAVAHADHIITVSEHTKKDLVKYFQANPKKISVTYEAVHSSFEPMNSSVLDQTFGALKNKYNLPNNFFLYVGLLKPHKNVHQLINVFRQLHQSKSVKTPLVIVGKKDSSYSREYQALASLKSDDVVIHIPRVDFGELRILYNQATALIHPSLYEGFGLTPLESMSCGTPVIVSSAASLPEVVGDAAYLVDTTREDVMMNAIQRVESEPSLREDLKAKGLERASLFSWKKCAEENDRCLSKGAPNS